MRMRFCATMRRPAFSITALMAPVRLRAVASGLMIENVRSTAIGVLFGKVLGDGLIESMPARGKAAWRCRAVGMARLDRVGATLVLALVRDSKEGAHKGRPYGGSAQHWRARQCFRYRRRLHWQPSHRDKMNISSLGDFLLNIHHQRCVITKILRFL